MGIILNKIKNVNQRSNNLGGNNFNGYNNNQPSLKDLVFGQCKINDNITRKLYANGKMMENINAKLEGFSSARKNQLSFQ